MRNHGRRILWPLYLLAAMVTVLAALGVSDALQDDDPVERSPCECTPPITTHSEEAP